MEHRGARTTNSSLRPGLPATERRERDSGKIAPEDQLERTPIPPRNSTAVAARKTGFWSGAKFRLLPAKESMPATRHCEVKHSLLKVADSPIQSLALQQGHSLLSSPARCRIAPEKLSSANRQCRLPRMEIHN